MRALAHFQAAWERADQLSALHAYLARQLAAALRPDELLRAEWAARVSALDLYVHELVAQGMLEIFDGRRRETPAFNRFQISNETLFRIRGATSPGDASAAFELDVRGRLGFMTFQDPEKIAEGIRLISEVELWNALALATGATAATKTAQAKALKRGLSIIVDRRNKIVHEGDMQPGVIRSPWPISRTDLQHVTSTILQVVTEIDRVIV